MSNINEVKMALNCILIPGKKQPITPFLWGKPGVGKSQSVLQLAQDFTKKTGKPFQFIDLRLSQLESADIRGVPVPCLDEGICKWLPPEFLPFDSVNKFKGTQGILLLDELNRARTDVLQAAFQLVLDRQVGMHRILDSWFIIGAGNYGLEDRTDVNEFDGALKNRFIHFDVDVDLETWLDWAKSVEIHDDIIGYIQTHNGHLYYTGKEDDNVFVTPRSWEKFSDILKANPNIDSKEINQILGKNIINGLAGYFHKYLESRDIVSAEDVLKRYESVKTKIKTMTRDQVLMLNNEVVTYIAKRTLEASEKTISMVEENLIKYMEKNLELDNKVAFLQSLTRACSESKNDFLTNLLKNHNELSKLVVATLAKKKEKK